MTNRPRTEYGHESVLRGPFVLAIAVAIVFCSTLQAPAREQAEEFVAGLRERGLFELTNDYLSQMENSKLADADFRQRIALHRGLTLLDQARQTNDRDQQAALLQKSKAELDKFAAANPATEAAAGAMLELANVYAQLGKRRVAEADDLPSGAAYASERKDRQAAARRAFDDADPLFKQAEDFYAAAIEKSPANDTGKSKNDATAAPLRGKLAEVSVLRAQTHFDKAATYPADSADFRKLNTATAKELSALFDKYSHWLVGFYARLYEGRCYQALADYQKALGCYDELISQPSVHPAFRKLITCAYAYQTECLVAQKKYDDAIKNSTTWLADAHTDEAQTPEWLMARYRLAQAIEQKADAPETKSTDKRKLKAEARDAYRLVAKTPNEFQRSAKASATALGATDDHKRVEPRDFNAAYEAGKDAMASINAAKMALPSAEKNNPSAVPELQSQIEQGKDDARRYFHQALSLVADDTDHDKLNEVRYFLCWLSWDNKDYYETAVLGDFLARRYPQHPSAQAAAQLALAAYEQLHRAANSSDRNPRDVDFEMRQMADTAEFITRKWPNTPAAESAFRVLVSTAIRDNKIDQAKDLLNKVSESARPALQTQLGNAMWGQYLEQSQLTGSKRPDDATLAKLKSEAIALLKDGFASAGKSGKVSELAATSGLYLAQAALSDNDYDGAIKLLEQPKIGPLTLVQSGDDAAVRQEYVVEVYKAALRAYLSTKPPQAKKALDTVQKLEKSVAASGGERADQLTRIYTALLLSLNQQIDQLRDDKHDAEAAARVSAAFAPFVDHIAARPEANGWTTRYYVAQAYYNIGQSFDSADNSGKAKQYLTKARDIQRQLLDDAAKDPSVAPNASVLPILRRQLGECYRQLGDYKAAIGMFSELLKDQEGQLSVQQAAARAYEEWGQTGETKWLEMAIHGSDKQPSTGKNRIWGWLKLAVVAERAARTNPKYEDAFFESRLEVARCRYLVGAKAEGTEKQENLDNAKESIRSMMRLYPALGGDHWRGKFDDLLKEIQSAAGDQPVGLAEFAGSNHDSSSDASGPQANVTTDAQTTEGNGK